jgi:hypothetical protein
MYSPIKTVIKNKNMSLCQFHNNRLTVSLTKGQSTSIIGDLFTYIDKPEDIEMFLYNIAGGYIEVSYIVDKLFDVSTAGNVNGTFVTATQLKQLNKMSGQAAVQEKKEKQAEPVKLNPPPTEDSPVISAVPVDGADATEAKGLSKTDIQEAAPKDAAYAGMFVAPAEEKKAEAVPAIEDGVVAEPVAEKAVKNVDVKATVVEKQVKATRNKVK